MTRLVAPALFVAGLMRAVGQHAGHPRLLQLEEASFARANGQSYNREGSEPQEVLEDDDPFGEAGGSASDQV